MDDHIAFVSKDEKGKVKLEYNQQGEQRIRLWEMHEGATLETTFDSYGSILAQRVMKLDTDLIKNQITETLKEAQISGTKEKPFSDVKFSKPCPKCGEYTLSRYVEAFSSKKEIPIMPLYYCSNCKSQSYHMTNNYLEFLVQNNTGLFSEEELLEMKKDKSAFMVELKGYIISIFASKKIMNIK
jgi:hypothetical protein